LLNDLDQYYPREFTIRLILDNHSAHLSKETRVFLQTKPNRFKYVLTPKHGSWLNIVETLFGKMARTFQLEVLPPPDLRHDSIPDVAAVNLGIGDRAAP